MKSTWLMVVACVAMMAGTFWASPQAAQAEETSQILQFDMVVSVGGKELSKPRIAGLPGHEIGLETTTRDGEGNEAVRLKMTLVPTLEGATVGLAGRIDAYTNGEIAMAVEVDEQASLGDAVVQTITVADKTYEVVITPTLRKKE